MSKLLAAVVRENKLIVERIDEPTPHPDEALVQVAATSINQGEVRGIRSAPHWALTRSHGDAWCPGWDFAGTVLRPSANGVGPPAGARVVGWVRQGAWAERVAAPGDQMVMIPDGLPFALAATLPIAGLTAWHALRVGGLAAGKSVLVTGAAGGVGRFALQLVSIAGANAVGVVGSPERARSVSHLPGETVVGLPSGGKFDIILECIGGPSLTAALGLVAPFGAIVSYGNASGEQTCFEAGAAFRKPCCTLHSFSLFDELTRRVSNAEGLDDLTTLLTSGRLRTDIALEARFADVARACDELMARRVDGKAVLQIS